MKGKTKVKRKWEAGKMRRKGDMETNLKKKMRQKLMQEKKLHTDKHNFNPDKGEEDPTNADGQNMDVHNTDRLQSYVVILQLQAKMKVFCIESKLRSKSFQYYGSHDICFSSMPYGSI